MKKKLLLYSALLILSSSLTYGQVRFTTIPMDSELVARDLNTNLGTFTIKGLVNRLRTPYNSICFKIYRDLKLIDSKFRKLSYDSNNAPFNFSFQIPAGLHEYTVSVYGIENGVQILDTTINGLLAGDVYIIQGQSNAFAEQRDGQNADTNKSEFIRVFGNSDSSTAGLLANLKWFRGEGNGGLLENGHLGQWGLRLGRLLVDRMKIPVAIFNGSMGGKPINYFERPADYKTIIHSNYGRLYYRMTYTGLQNNVRAIMWSQGETDGARKTTKAAYINEFDTLQKAWRQDFPGFKKIYILQTKTEAIEPINNIMDIEEAQREITVEQYRDIEIIPTAALKQDRGGLHFDYTGGYEEFANRLYPLIARDLYGTPSKREIDAPMVTNAYLSDSTTLVVVEKADSLLQHNSAFSLQTLPFNSYQIENAPPGATINSIFRHKNKIILKLSKYPGRDVTVSYFAPIHDTGSNWLTNTNNLELICFYKYPVADSIGKTYEGIQNYTSSTLTLYPNPFSSYTKLIFSKKGTYKIELDDLAGKQIQSLDFTGIKFKFSSKGLPKGLYIIRVFDASNTITDSVKIGVN